MIKEIPNYLTESECSMIIGLGESGQLNIGRTNSNKLGYRKAKVTWFNLDNALIDRIKKDISEITQLPIENQEPFHFVKYSIGGEYKIHTDGKDRPKTALIYLNDGFVGGETEFPKLGIKIKPEMGKLVIWDNIEGSDHAGLPVELGTKYIGVIWINENKQD